LVARRTGARLRYIEMDDEGKLKLDDLDEQLTDRTRLVAMTHVSNALGTVNPVARIIEAAHARGALVLLDGAQAVPHMR
jgi:cysteine desulfurase/selenocysteine lyase